MVIVPALWIAMTQRRYAMKQQQQEFFDLELLGEEIYHHVSEKRKKSTNEVIFYKTT
jgi:hypothetical protein